MSSPRSDGGDIRPQEQAKGRERGEEVAERRNVSLDELNSKINGFLAQRSGLISELKKLRERKADLKAEIRDFNSKINQERTDLDNFSSQLRSFQEIRRDILARIREIRKKSTKVDGLLLRFEREAPNEDMEHMKEKLQKIDRTLQTERLTRQQEKDLVRYAKDLEVKLHLWKKAYSTRQELTALLKEIADLKVELDNINETGTKTRRSIGERHDHLDALILARRQLFDEIKGIDADIIELEKKLQDVEATISSLKLERTKILDSIREKEEERIKAKEKFLFESAKGIAKQKLEEGKKLSFDELRLLFSESGESVEN